MFFVSSAHFKHKHIDSQVPKMEDYWENAQIHTSYRTFNKKILSIVNVSTHKKINRLNTYSTLQLETRGHRKSRSGIRALPCVALYRARAMSGLQYCTAFIECIRMYFISNKKDETLVLAMLNLCNLLKGHLFYMLMTRHKDLKILLRSNR